MAADSLFTHAAIILRDDCVKFTSKRQRRQTEGDNKTESEREMVENEPNKVRLFS